MDINFDLLISGCNTRCRHCYVNGGPGRNILLSDALRCISRLDELGAALPVPSSFTLDNEPFNHPDIAAIIRAAASVNHIFHFHHGMTTGIALLRREDKEAVVRAYMDCGYTEFGITLHGSPVHHDEIVRREGACEASVKAAEFLKSCGAELSVSLMMNRFFPEDAGWISDTLNRLNPALIFFAVPNYTPHSGMPDFEPYRASLADLQILSSRLEQWRQQPAGLLREAEISTPAAMAAQLEQGLSLRELFIREQEELYLSVHQDRLLYMGNTGVETACLGDLDTLDLAIAANQISHAPGNRDYGAFYDPELLPNQEKLICALKRLPPGTLYGDPASVICRGLAELRLPTRMMAQLNITSQEDQQ